MQSVGNNDAVSVRSRLWIVMTVDLLAWIYFALGQRRSTHVIRFVIIIIIIITSI